MIPLIQGDCLEKMNYLEDASIDLILTDPPYGTTACKWDSIIPLEPMWKQLKRIIKPDGVTAIFGSEPFSSFLRISNIQEYKYDWIWNKILKTGHLNAQFMPMGGHEVISIFGRNINYYPIMEEGNPLHSEGENRKGKDTDNYRKQNLNYKNKKGNTQKYPSSLSLVFQKVHPSKCFHPTQKPVPLMEYLIKTYTKKHDVVLDFTMGSGTTGVACKLQRRNFIGIELDENYFKIAEKRIASINAIQNEIEWKEENV